jgi:glucose/arabinose dehydrogenase
VKRLLLMGGMAVALGVTPVVMTGGPAGARSGPGPVSPAAAVTVVADHLNNPRQLTVHGDAVYVAEAGTGGVNCPPGDAPCIGLTGSVTRVHHGRAERIQTGLLSVAIPGRGEVVGVDALAFRGDGLYGVATGSCDLPPGLPTGVLAQVGKVLRLGGGARVRAVADVSTIECTTDPDGQGPDSNPYGLAARGRDLYVADAGANDVLRVRRGRATVATVISRDGQPVPTSLAFGPDGALYIGTLNFQGGPGTAKVYRFDTRRGELSVYADGLFAITGLAFGHGGWLYVSQFTTALGAKGPEPDGVVVAVPWGGGTGGRRTIGAGALHFPGGVAVMGGHLYVSNWSTAAGEDGPLGPGRHGQLVRIALDHAPGD